MQKTYGNSWKIIFEPQTSGNTMFDEFAESFFEVVTIDYNDDGLEIYSGYLPHEPDEKLLKKAAENFGIKLPEYSCEFIPAANWLTKNVIKFPPIETDDFLIYGSHEENRPQTDKLAIRIYAATAFGSGQHQTTRSCLKLLSLLNAQGFKAQNILDMGCGSGILALSACSLWKNAKALGVDIDDEAVAVTLQNAADNELSEKVHAVQSNGYSNPQIAQHAPFQLIFANILARPLIEMAPDLSENLVSGGYAVLSGFTDEQFDWVTETYRPYGLLVKEIVADENWRAVLLEKTK